MRPRLVEQTLSYLFKYREQLELHALLYSPCGMCGTPYATCDGACVDAAYISIEIEELDRFIKQLKKED